MKNPFRKKGVLLGPWNVTDLDEEASDDWNMYPLRFVGDRPSPCSVAICGACYSHNPQLVSIVELKNPAQVLRHMEHPNFRFELRGVPITRTKPP